MLSASRADKSPNTSPYGTCRFPSSDAWLVCLAPCLPCARGTYHGDQSTEDVRVLVRASPGGTCMVTERTAAVHQASPEARPTGRHEWMRGGLAEPRNKRAERAAMAHSAASGCMGPVPPRPSTCPVLSCSTMHASTPCQGSGLRTTTPVCYVGGRRCTPVTMLHRHDR